MARPRKDGKKGYEYCDADAERVKIYGEIGAPLAFIVKVIGCDRTNLYKDTKLGRIYKEARDRFMLKLFNTLSYKAVETGNMRAIEVMMHLSGYGDGHVDLDFTDASTYAERCAILDAALADRVITVDQYRLMSDSLSNQAQVGTIVDDVAAIKNYFSEHGIPIQYEYTEDFRQPAIDQETLTIRSEISDCINQPPEPSRE